MGGDIEAFFGRGGGVFVGKVQSPESRVQSPGSSPAFRICRSPCDFASKTRETEQGYLKCMPSHIADPVVRTDGHVTITSLPKFLGLTGYQIWLAMVLRWCATRAGSARKSPINTSMHA